MPARRTSCCWAATLRTSARPTRPSSWCGEPSNIVRTCWAVAGNCDSQAIDERLASLGVSLFGRGVMHQQAGLYGVSAMPPWTGTMYELSEDEIARALWSGRQQLAQPQWEIVLSHTPPRDTLLDRTRRGKHVGSRAVRQFVEQVQPALLLCGHIHESRGVDRLGATTLVNCGPAFAGQYAVAELDSQVHVELRRGAPRYDDAR